MIKTHANAAGFSLPVDNIEKFIEYANEQLKEVDFNENIYNVDFIKKSNNETIPEMILDLTTYPEIWGKGNEEPYIVIEDIILSPEELKVIGSNKDTIKFSACGIEFIKFKDQDLIDKIQGMKQINLTVLGRASINNFMGASIPQILIEDYNVRDSFFDF